MRDSGGNRKDDERDRDGDSGECERLAGAGHSVSVGAES